MSAFRVTVAGLTYIGIFASQLDAAINAEQLYPHAWPAQVIRVGGPNA